MMASAKRMIRRTIRKVKAAGRWVKSKLAGDKKEVQPLRGLVIGVPTDVRREAITFAVDADGNTVIISQPRAVHARESRVPAFDPANPPPAVVASVPPEIIARNAREAKAERKARKAAKATTNVTETDEIMATPVNVMEAAAEKTAVNSKTAAVAGGNGGKK